MAWNNIKLVKAHILLLKKNIALAEEDYCNFMKKKSKFLWEALASQLNTSTQPIGVFYNLLFYIRTINIAKKALTSSDTVKTSDVKKESKKTKTKTKTKAKTTDTAITPCCKFKLKSGKNKGKYCELPSIDGHYCKLHMYLLSK
jgi:hypothetical protein